MAPNPSSRALMTLAAGLLVQLGCSPAQPIRPAEGSALVATTSGHATSGALSIEASVLPEEQAKESLRVDPATIGLLPIAFVARNDGRDPWLLSQTDFRLGIDDLTKEAPALPGRAANLLRDPNEASAAIWAGYLVFGILAAPSINAAEGHERAAVESNYALIFKSATVAPGATQAGYLFFESPKAIDQIHHLNLTVTLVSRGTDTPAATIELDLINPYAG